MDVSGLGPADCAAALRSFPRRYRAALASLEEDESPDDLAHHAGPDGRSAIDHVDHVARATGMIGSALHDILTREDAALQPEVFDDGARAWAATGDKSMESALDHLTVEVRQLAGQIDATHGEQWALGATIAGPGGRRVTALDLAREAAKTGAEHLRAAEAAMQAARRGS